jgi:twitching motility protein PilT
MTKGQPIDSHASSEHEPELNKLFKLAVEKQASDLHLKAGQPPKVRIYGELKNTTGEVMTKERVEQLVFELLGPEQKEFFLKTGTLDFAHEIGSDRFRINIFRQRGMISLSSPAAVTGKDS